MQLTNILIWGIVLGKTFKLTHENSFYEITIEKHIIDINLTNVSMITNNSCKNNPNSGRLDNMTKCFKTVNA